MGKFPDWAAQSDIHSKCNDAQGAIDACASAEAAAVSAVAAAAACGVCSAEAVGETSASASEAAASASEAAASEAAAAASANDAAASKVGSEVSATAAAATASEAAASAASADASSDAVVTTSLQCFASAAASAASEVSAATEATAAAASATAAAASEAAALVAQDAIAAMSQIMLSTPGSGIENISGQGQAFAEVPTFDKDPASTGALSDIFDSLADGDGFTVSESGLYVVAMSTAWDWAEGETDFNSADPDAFMSIRLALRVGEKEIAEVGQSVFGDTGAPDLFKNGIAATGTSVKRLAAGTKVRAHRFVSGKKKRSTSESFTAKGCQCSSILLRRIA